jgi:hypothetical protein
VQSTAKNAAPLTAALLQQFNDKPLSAMRFPQMGIPPGGAFSPFSAALQHIAMGHAIRERSRIVGEET